MRAIRFEGQTNKFGAPVGVEETDCFDLAVKVSDDQVDDGMGLCFRSYWKPTQEELDALTNGASIELNIRGRSQPPVMLSVVHIKETHDA